MAERIGRYRVLEPIGSGGCATVHLAQMEGPLGFSRTLAVKRLHDHVAADSELRVWLLDEARLTSRIRSPFVVPTLDVVAEGRELLIVMEYVIGEPLVGLMRDAAGVGEPIAPDVACAIMIDVLQGLHAAHELRDDAGDLLQIVHRDVSPHNVMVGDDGIARLLDFGIAKAIDRLQTTREGRLKGKLTYMAPEQVLSGNVDRRTDVFAASVVLWEMLTGRRLYGGPLNDVKTTMRRVLEEVVEAPSKIVATVPAALDAVIAKALAKKPEDRYETALAMVTALEAAVRRAAPARVAEWIDGRKHDALVARRRRVAELDRMRGDGPSLSSTAAADGAAEGTGSAEDIYEPTGSDVEAPAAPRERRRERGRRTVLVTVALALATLSGAAAFTMRPRAATEAREPSVLSTASAGAGPTSPIVPIAPASEAPAALEPVASAVPTSSSAPPSVSAAPRPRTKASTPKVSPKPDCSNPYYLDAEGRRRYRRECLTR